MFSILSVVMDLRSSAWVSIQQIHSSLKITTGLSMNEVYFLLVDKDFSHSEGEDRDFKGEGSDFEGEVCGYRPEVCPSRLLKEDGAGM